MKSMKTRTAAEAGEEQRFDEPQGFGRSHVLSNSGKSLFVRYDPGDSKDRYFIWGLFTEKATNRMVYVYSLQLACRSPQWFDDFLDQAFLRLRWLSFQIGRLLKIRA